MFNSLSFIFVYYLEKFLPSGTQRSSTMTKERTPKTPRSVVRNHSPYCESTGPIVQEGFVAARVRALQGFSGQAQSIDHFLSPVNQCPRSSFELDPVSFTISDIDTPKGIHDQRFSKVPQNLVGTPEKLASLSDVAPFFRWQEQRLSSGPADASQSHIRGEGEEVLCKSLFEDSMPSSCAQKDQDLVTALSSPRLSLSEGGRVDNIPARSSTPSGKSILSPHAIQADLVEPQTAWICLPQTEDRNNDYVHGQALKPRGSIAEKLGSLVEQGWEGDETYSIVYSNNKCPQDATGSEFSIRNLRLDSRSDDEAPSLKQAPSHRRSPSVSVADMRSTSQRSTGQANIPSVEQKVPRKFMHRNLQREDKGQSEASYAVKTPQRSRSDIAVRYLKAEPTNPRGKRRARTLHSLGRLTSRHDQTQLEASAKNTYSYAWDYRDCAQDLTPTTLPLSCERSVPKPSSDLAIPRNEQLDQDFAALLKNASSRRSSSDTKASTRSISRSTSFFKKFPWYKVALVDKESVNHGLSRGGWGTERTSRATHGVHLDSTSNQIELSRGVNRPSTFVGSEREKDEGCPKEQPSHQDPVDQQAGDTMTSYYKASSQPDLQSMTCSEEMNERDVLERAQRVPQRLQDSYIGISNTRDERLSKYPHHVVKNASGHAQGSRRRGLSDMSPSTSLESRPRGYDCESTRSSDVGPTIRPQRSEAEKLSCMQPYQPSYAKTTIVHANGRKEKCSSGSETIEPAQRFTYSPSLPPQHRSEIFNLGPKSLRTGQCSSPASAVRSDQNVPVHREAQPGGKGIKKIQVTVTFDGAGDFVVDATLMKSDRREHHEGHWRDGCLHVDC